MRWGLIQVNEPKHLIVTYDAPVLMSNGLDHERGFIVM